MDLSGILDPLGAIAGKLQANKDDDLVKSEAKPAAKKSTKKMASGGKVGGRGDGIAQRGRTKGRFV